jgi:hypothetical protein
MYKTRIELWGLHKKRKAPEMLAGLTIIKRRKLLGKATCIVVKGRNRAFSEAEIEAYFKRHKMSTSEKHLLETATATTPPGMGYYTPLSSKSPIPIANDISAALGNIPDEPLPSIHFSAPRPSMRVPSPSGRSWLTLMRATTQPEENMSRREETCGHRAQSQTPGKRDLMELMSLSADDMVPLPSLEITSCYEQSFTELNRYYEHYFTSRQWSFWKDENFSFHKQPFPMSSELGVDVQSTFQPNERQVIFPHVDFEDPARLVGAFEVAIRLYGTMSAKEGDKLMDNAFEKLSVLLREEHPQFLSCLLLLLSVLDKADLVELIDQLLTHTYHLSNLIHGPSYPITRLISWLAQCGGRDELFDKAFECVKFSFYRFAGRLHPQSLELSYNHAWSKFRRYRYDEALSDFKEYRWICEISGHPDDLGTRKILLSTAQVHMAKGDLTTADLLLEEVQRRIISRFGQDKPIEMTFECSRLQAALWERQGRGFDQSTLTSDRLYDAEKALGCNHPTVVLLRNNLLRLKET